MNSSIAIVLAWPDTYCKQAGSWYDPLMQFLGFNRNYYYRAGHAAVILVQNDTGECHYFDFGRYHSPYQTGRTRSKWTDPELTIYTKAKFIGNKLRNIRDILNEVALNKACHGQGELYASIASIDFDKAYSKAIMMQSISPIKYGPFIPKGTNCSRFVRTILLAGKVSFYRRLKLWFPYTITPSPLTNVLAFKFQYRIKSVQPCLMSGTSHVNGVLKPPTKPSQVPTNAQWLSGEGAGSWYLIEPFDYHYKITRFDPDGVVEFSSLYDVVSKSEFYISKDFDIIPISHYARIRVIQGVNEFYFYQMTTEIPLKFMTDPVFRITAL